MVNVFNNERDLQIVWPVLRFIKRAAIYIAAAIEEQVLINVNEIVLRKEFAGF